MDRAPGAKVAVSLEVCELHLDASASCTHGAVKSAPGKTAQVAGKADKAWAMALCGYVSTLAVEWPD